MTISTSLRITTLIFAQILLSACGSSSSPVGSVPTGSGGVVGGSGGPTAGTVSLAGPDVTNGDIPAVLDTGYAGAAPSVNSGTGSVTPEVLIVVDKDSTVTGVGGVLIAASPGDPNNTIGLSIVNNIPSSASSASLLVTLVITINGIDYEYGCTSPVTLYGECGSGAVALNLAARTVTFSSMNLVNVGSNSTAPVIVNGSLSW